AVDEQDNLWIKYEGNIAYFDVATESFAEIDFPDGYFSLNSGEITCDKFGRLWIGLDGGVAVYENEQWQTFGFLGKECSEISTRARKLEFAPNGDLWIGTFVGLFRYTPDYDSTEITRQSNVPETVTLYNHPNPFNPSTTIEFTLPESGFATITIYSLTGQKIREIEADFMPAGTHTLSWDGRDTSGNIVSSGIYITRLEAGKHTATGRMVLVR
ncbi:MAG: T9SS type A sorting domain-containing protein, partial [Candidatus Latescibacteria bacterium]|nr:T9SS type A sorting domain-containing protein [Candidatus Latescibacterota bacterium]